MVALQGFIGPSGRVRSSNASAERCLNLYVEEVESQRGTYVLYSMPGLRSVALLPSAPVRGLYGTKGGRVFAVTSTTLFEVFAGWTFLSRGTIPTGTTPVAFTDDGEHMVLSVGGTGLAYHLATNVLATIVPDDGGMVFGQLAYIDGRVLTNQPDSTRFWYSDPFNATSWPALNYYDAAGRPDPLMTLVIDHRELLLFGTESTEVWFPTGNALAPFARNQNVFLEQGIQTPWSVETLDNQVYWLGGSKHGEGPMWTLEGYQPVRVSTHAAEHAMKGMTSVADTITTAVRDGGHAWVIYDFPSGGQTWAYDTLTKAWTELPGLLANGTLTNYLSNQHCVAFGAQLWGDRTTGRLYIWDVNYHFYGTTTRLCRRTSPHVRANQQPLRYRAFRLEAEAGVGLDGTPAVGSNPPVMLRTSIDGGHTWGNGRWRSAGPIGATRQQLCWYQLGQARQMAFEVTQTDPCPVAWLAADVEVD